jgi:pimeloyl-ACP methyl ester carboxylesterase
LVSRQDAAAVGRRQAVRDGGRLEPVRGGGGGLRLHVSEWGRADGPPILFFHGLSQNHFCWTRQYRSSLADEFRLVAYDLRGHGMSQRPWHWGTTP